MKKENIHLPKHVAIIMDGNRRWAKNRHLPYFFGHRQGAKQMEPIIGKAAKMGIPYLTFWAFSTENWERDRDEVKTLMKVFRFMLHDAVVGRMKKNNVRVGVIGDISTFPKDIVGEVEELVRETEGNSAITVNFALNYGGREEIMRAIEKLRASSKFKVQSSKLMKEDLEKCLDTAGQPDPDLLIRTGGEKRLSGFLLWQLEYAELYFTDVLWPEFTESEFQKAVDEYLSRQRRFGK